MKHIQNFGRLSYIFLALLIIGCTQDDPTEPTDENTLLYSSFEKNGKFSSDGWTLPAQSDSSADVPAGGGSYSLKLRATAPPEEYASIKVPANINYTVFKLTFWSKSSGVTNDIYAKAILSLVRNGTILKSQSILIDQINWRSFSIQDTFNIAEGDSLMVQLSGGMHQLLPLETYFDLCRLYGID